MFKSIGLALALVFSQKITVVIVAPVADAQ
jgi:hypothetical protein